MAVRLYRKNEYLFKFLHWIADRVIIIFQEKASFQVVEKCVLTFEGPSLIFFI